MKNSVVEPVAVPEPLSRSFYCRSTEVVARNLLGMAVVRRIGRVLLGGVVVETEAYLKSNDPACHANRGMTPRNEVMFGECGKLYVYSIHAKHCMNVVTQKPGKGCAVLIRAIQPLWGIEQMQRNRGVPDVQELTNGPAKLCQSLFVALDFNGHDLTHGKKLWIGKLPDLQIEKVVVTSRIGISQGAEMPLRFFVDRNRYVSGLKRDHTGIVDQQFELK